MMHLSTQLKYAQRIEEVNVQREHMGFKPIQIIWHQFNPACKMRVVGKDLKGFTRRFVINQLNIERK